MILRYPLGLLALLAVPVIILLYLLKQKHEEYIIPSLYLWKNALNDIEANSPWQKLKRNILMLLQIFAIILLALIISEPIIRNAGSKEEPVLLVIDCSLSMQSADIKPTRFDAAVADALKLVDSLSPGTEITVIASASKPYIPIHKAVSSDNAIMEIKSLKASDTAEDIEGTVKLVQSLIRDNPEIRVCWFSDGNNPLDNIEYYSYNRNGNNYAVTLLSYRKNNDGTKTTALSRISNFSVQDAELDVSLYTDGNFYDAQRIKLGAGKTGNIYWSDLPGSANMLELSIDTDDVLAKDNKAGVMIQSDEARKVLLATEKNIFLEKLLSLIPYLDIYRTDIEDMDEFKGYDLYIFDGKLPEKLPEDGHSILFKPSPNEYFSVSGISEYSSIRAADHPIYSNLKQDISFSTIKTDIYNLPEWAAPIMVNDEGTAAFEGYMGRRRIMVFGFDLHDTNLPVQPFFPVIMTRAVQELIPAGSDKVSSVFAGEPIGLSVDPKAKEVYVINPDGYSELVAPPFPVASFEGTTKIGAYSYEQHLEEGIKKQQFFVNAPTEKEISLSNSIPSGLSVDAEASEDGKAEGVGRSPVPGGLSLKVVLIWMLLAILIIEWWVYSNGIAV